MKRNQFQMCVFYFVRWNVYYSHPAGGGDNAVRFVSCNGMIEPGPRPSGPKGPGGIQVERACLLGREKECGCCRSKEQQSCTYTILQRKKKTFCEVASLIRYRPAKREHFFLFLKNSKQSQICFFLNLWRNITESYPNRKMNKINILYAEGGRKNPLE